MDRLAKQVRMRRQVLGLTQRDAAVRAGISDQTWLNVEAGARVTDRTLRRVERALGWSPGSADTVAAGGDPVELPGEDEDLRRKVAELEARIARLEAESAARKRREAS